MSKQELFKIVDALLIENLNQLNIKIDYSRTDNNKIYVLCSQDRVDTKKIIQKLLTERGLKFKDVSKSYSGFKVTEVHGYSSKTNIVYKSTKGGMNETTLNSSITELFPCIAFETGNTETDVDKYYSKISQCNKPNLGAYKNDSAFKAGKDVVNKSESSTKFKQKVKGAIGITKWINEQSKRKPISKVVWGYRNNTKPDGVNPNHKGDVFLVYKDGSMLGVSIKAGSQNSAEPQLNTYVKPIFDFFGKKTEYEKLSKVSYETFYQNIPGISPYKNYGTKPMTITIGNFEKSNRKEYERLYDEQLEWIKESLINLFNQNPDLGKKWLLEKVCAEQENVPLVILKATDSGQTSLVKDEDIIKSCVKSSKTYGGLKAYSSGSSSKQNWHIDLICNSYKTTLNFSIRTNKTGIDHKLGQYINLAVKFNGIKK